MPLCFVQDTSRTSYTSTKHRQLGPVSEYIINAYCGGLSATFAQFVYYGILKAEDAQCFRVNTSAESGLFLLAAGSILLALLNSFVLKAVRQHNRDKRTRVDHRKTLALEDRRDLVETIHPVPVLFTDRFRWLLRRETTTPTLKLPETQDDDDDDDEGRWEEVGRWGPRGEPAADEGSCGPRGEPAVDEGSWKPSLPHVGEAAEEAILDESLPASSAHGVASRIIV